MECRFNEYFQIARKSMQQEEEKRCQPGGNNCCLGARHPFRERLLSHSADHHNHVQTIDDQLDTTEFTSIHKAKIAATQLLSS